MASPTWFERFLDGTLGYPQQLLFRLMKILAGERQAFSREGLLDPALIPLGALFTDDSNRISAEDFGIDSTIGAIAFELALDPMTYLTAGLSSYARGARALGKAAGLLGVSSEELKKAGTVAKALEKLRDAAKAAEHSKAFGLVEEAAQRLDDLADLHPEKALERVMEHELMVGLPFSVLGKKLAVKVPTQHRSWFALMADPFGRTAAHGIAMLGARNIPGVSELARTISAFHTGMRIGPLGRAVLEFPDAEKGVAIDVLERSEELERLAFKIEGKYGPRGIGWTSIVDRSAEKGESAQEAFRKVFGIRKKDADTVPGQWAALTKKVYGQEMPLEYDVLRALPEELLKVRDIERSVMRDLTLTRRFRTEKVARDFAKNPTAFELGERLSRAYARIFKGNTGFKELDALEKEKNAYLVRLTRFIGFGAEGLTKLMIRFGKEAGYEYEDVRKFFDVLFQVVPHEDEIAYVQKAALEALEAGDLTAFQRQIDRNLADYMDRVANIAVLLDREKGPYAELMKRGLMRSGVPPMLPPEVRASTLKSGTASMAFATMPDVDTGFGRLARARVQLREWRKRAKAAMKAGESIGPPPTSIIDDIVDGLRMVKDEAMRPFWETFTGKAGEAFDDAITAIRDVQAMHLEVSSRLGWIGRSIPIAYVPRVTTLNETERIRKILSAIDRNDLEALLGPQRSAHVREADRMSIETLNELVGGLRKMDAEHGGGTLYGDVAASLAKSVPELDKRYSDDVVTSFLASLANAKEYEGVAHFIDEIVNRSMESGSFAAVTGGTVVAYGEGRRVVVRSGKLNVVGKVDEAGNILEVGVRGREFFERLPDHWLVIQRPDGKQFIISTASTLNDLVIAAGKGEGTVGGALASQIATGRSLTRLVSTTPPGELAKLAEKRARVLVGTQDVVGNLAHALGRQVAQTPAALRSFYDPIHSLLRAAVTVVRPDFHLWNLASSLFMAHMNGLPMREMMLGTADALRFLRQDVRGFDDAYARLLAWEKDTGVVPALGAVFAPQAVRSARLQGRIAMARRGKMTFHVASQEYDLQEVMDSFMKEGLFSTFISEGLRTGGRETKRLQRIRRAAEAVTLGFRKAGKNFWDANGLMASELRQLLSQAGEFSEIVARLSAAFGYMRMGLTPDLAAREAVRAMINYADVTNIERAWMKRAISFYTFPRKMMPNVIAWVGKNPGQAAAQMKVAFGAPFTSAEHGRLQAAFGDYQVNLQRALPQFDVLSYGAFLGDLFLHWDGIQHTPERVGENAFRLAIPLRFIQEMVFPDAHHGMSQAIQNMMRLSYVTRWTVRDPYGDDPLAPEQTVWDKIAAQVIGLRKTGRIIRIRWLLGQHNLLLSEARERLRQEPENRAFWQSEIRALTATTRRLLRELPR